MTPAEYLTEKVSKVIPDSERIYNEGARIISNYPAWEYAIEELSTIAWDTFLKYSLSLNPFEFRAGIH